MVEIPLEQPSPLNLTLHGGAGRFKVESESQRSVEVRYFLTNVGLALGQGTNDQLLSVLAPVREVFKTEELGFDELMQRDIDDARVTSELVPYLLDDQSAGMVKLFPPIVVMILPKSPGQEWPDRLYPSVVTERQDGEHFDKQVTRIGDLGAELIVLEQPITGDNRPVDHDRVRLHLNTHTTRLVIVDGQHRAMALLAIFRNLQDQWTDSRRAPYKDFYAEWTPEVIGAFKLDHVQLPVMLCFVPELAVGTDVDFDLVKASRQVFLTLNKTARKVSESRNRLLDDADLMAVFLRSTLEKVKSRQTEQATRMRLWGVELDQLSDRQRVQNPLALTGVNHVYYLIEHLMLSGDDVHGIRARAGRYASRTSLSDCLRRLDGYDLLGAEAQSLVRRDSFTSSDADDLTPNFSSRYGDIIIRMFDDFAPYSVHNEAVHTKEKALRSDSDTRVHSILFGNQGAHQGLQNHLMILSRRKDKEQIADLVDRLQDLEARVGSAIDEVIVERGTAFLAPALIGSVESSTSLLSAIGTLYRQYFTSVAMQAALVGTFFGEVERAERRPGTSINREAEFGRYMGQISRFFRPSNKKGLERLLGVFQGEVVPTSDDPWRTIPSDKTFRKVVFTGEMQPDQWPKLRYLMLELWEPGGTSLASQVVTEVQVCRQQIIEQLFARARAQEASARGVPEDDLSTTDLEALADGCVEALTHLVSNLGAHTSISREEAKGWALGPPAVAQDENGDSSDLEP